MKKTKTPTPKRYFAGCSNCDYIYWTDKEKLFARCPNCKTLLTWNDSEKLRSFTVEEGR